MSGLVTYRRVRAVPPERWTTTAVDDVALPLDQLWTAAPDEKLLDVLARGRGGDGRIVVLDRGQLVGIVSPVDITQAIQRLGLHADLGRRLTAMHASPTPDWKSPVRRRDRRPRTASIVRSAVRT